MNQFEDGASKQSSFHDIINKYPYSPASAASSSSVSLFSVDGKSSQSSAPSSVKSGSPTWDLDNNTSQSVAPTGYSEFPPNNNGSLQASQPTRISQQNAVHVQQIICPNGAVAPELRTHPRRTQPSVQLDQKDVRAPPSLVRQCDRKDNFVESLVETTTQMIEVIWPLSVIPCDRDTVLGGKNLIGLRTFIQEVLKRSKTSYSTLQVALYYLVLVKPCIPKVDFTKEQTEDSHATRAMQCGRRMFLAALILASKYLQDRNYSARAWSKISGLKVEEINSNERAFVAAVNWNLHVPEQRFQRWTDVVLKYSLSQPSQPSLRFNESSPPNCWRSIIPRLTPELKDLEVPELAKPNNVPVPVFSKCPVFSTPMCPPPSFRRIDESPLGSGESTPTPGAFKPAALEPTPRASRENFRFPPISPRITQLPTPVMTPQTTGFITPAASVGSYCRGQSMSDAMKQIQRSAMDRCTMDTWPCAPPVCEAFSTRKFPAPSRRPSYALSSSSTISSPESMISDFPSSQGSSCSSRTSRSSSVCSVASSAGALPQPTRLAVQATRRCATLAAVKEQAFGRFSTESHPSSVINDPFIRCFENSESSEAAAALALSDMACSKPYVSSSMGASIQRKRERPSSIVNGDFDNAVRLALLNSSEAYKAADGSIVSEDSRPATSFLLRDEQRRLPFERVSSSCVRSTSGSRNGARKRTCKDETWSNADMTASPYCI